MRIVLAPDKFKGCLSAAQVAGAMALGLRRADAAVEVDSCPMADGGEGTVEAMVAATAGTFHTRRVTGPLPEMKVDARFGILGDGKTAVIEMAAASGLALLKTPDRDPMRTTTYGTGELLMAAVKMGVSRIVLGIGGSATVDGGIGCAQACDLPVILQEGGSASPAKPLVGADVARVAAIQRGQGSGIEAVQIVVACDVTNPLYGPHGAAAVFGPQKGATPQQVRQLDAALEQLAARTGNTDAANRPGAGAAGGLGFAMAAFFAATLQSGIDIVIEATGLGQRLASTDLCLTGEGRLDSQSLHGKAVAGVARACQSAGVPCIALAGSVEHGPGLYGQGLTAALSICDGPMGLDEAMASAERLIAAAAENLLRVYATARGPSHFPKPISKQH